MGSIGRSSQLGLVASDPVASDHYATDCIGLFASVWWRENWLYPLDVRQRSCCASIAVFACLEGDSFEEGNYATLAFFMFIFPFGWASSFGPWVVELTEKLYHRIIRDYPTEN